jgi:AcrR family transcriptional regulator
MNRQERRDAILTVAGESFLTDGYAGTTMSGIAATLGGSKGTLWSYFRSKEELFEAVLDHATIEYRSQLSSLLDPCGDLRSTLERFGASLVAKITSPPAIALHRLVQAEAGRSPEVGEIYYERGPRRTQQLLADFLQAAMERGMLRQDDPLRAARALLTLLMCGTHQQMLLGRIGEPTADALAADAAMAMDVFLRAYGPTREHAAPAA